MTGVSSQRNVLGEQGGDQPRADRLADVAYASLRREIVRGELASGTVLAEVEVAERLGVSKTPVREALRKLLEEGLLEVGAKRQLMVRGFTAEHRLEVLRVREALESLAVGLACEVAPEQLDDIHVLLRRQRRAAEAGDEEAFIDLDEEFHLALAETAGLPTVAKFLRELRGFVRVMRSKVRRDLGYLTEVQEEHVALLEAIEAGDRRRAVRALKAHLRKSDYEVGAP